MAARFRFGVRRLDAAFPPHSKGSISLPGCSEKHDFAIAGGSATFAALVPPAHRRIRFAYGLTIAVVLAIIFGLHFHRQTGLTSLIRFGGLRADQLAPELAGIPVYVVPNHHGYDGQYYAHLALHPPWIYHDLTGHFDFPSYRARRIFLPALAYALGWGRPAWIVQIFPLLNIAAWLALAWLLTRWLPPTDWTNFGRWSGCLLAAGCLESIRGALTDLPGVFLAMAALRLFEDRREKAAAGVFAMAILTRETLGLCALGVFFPAGAASASGWARAALLGLAAVLPTVCWAVYVAYYFRNNGGATGNFGWPFAAVAGACADAWRQMAAGVQDNGRYVFRFRDGVFPGGPTRRGDRLPGTRLGVVPVRVGVRGVGAVPGVGGVGRAVGGLARDPAGDHGVLLFAAGGEVVLAVAAGGFAAHAARALPAGVLIPVVANRPSPALHYGSLVSGMTWFHFDPQSFAFSFLSVLFESVPFLLLGALISGLIEVFVPARWMTGILPRKAFPAVLISALLGLVFPMCECGVVPVIRRLMKKGLPVSCAVTYLLASPVVNPITAISTFAAFRGQQPGPDAGVPPRAELPRRGDRRAGRLAPAAGAISQRPRARNPARARHPAHGRVPGRRAGGGVGVWRSAPFSLEGTEDGSGGDADLSALDALEAELRPTLFRSGCSPPSSAARTISWTWPCSW